MSYKLVVDMDNIHSIPFIISGSKFNSNQICIHPHHDEAQIP